MSVLDTFVLIFESDTSELKKADKEVDGILDGMENKIEDVGDVSQELGDSFTEMTKSAGAALAAVLSVGVVGAKVLDAANQAFEITQLSRALGENAGEIDAWGAAIQKRGGDANTFFSSIEGFNERVQELSLVMENDLSPAMRELGIDFLDQQGRARSMLDILPELADAFSRVDPAKAQGLGARFGLDRDTILLLMEGRQAVEELVKEQKLLGVITKEDEEITRKWNMQLADNERMLRSVFLGIATATLPAITAFFEGVEDIFIFMSEHKAFMVTFFTAIGAAALWAGRSFIIAWAAAAAPILLIIGLITAVGAAIALVVDDIYSFGKGFDSVTGRIVNYLKRIPDAFENQVIKPLTDKWTEFKEFFGFGDNDFIANAQNNLAVAAATPLASQTSNSLTTISQGFSRNSNVNIGTVEVNTQATDAEGVGKALNDTLQDQVSQAIDDFDDGVAG